MMHIFMVRDYKTIYEAWNNYFSIRFLAGLPYHSVIGKRIDQFFRKFEVVHYMVRYEVVCLVVKLYDAMIVK